MEPTVRDDVLRLMFTACHPVLSAEARVALTLRMVAGLTTDEIARAFLVPTPTMAARVTRAKKALTAAGVPFEVPVGDELAPRLASVLETVYLLFNEGYTATSGSAWTRPELCQEAMRLGRMLAGLAPQQAEAHGLVALMEIQASRLRGPGRRRTARRSRCSTRTARRWDRTLITHALARPGRAPSPSTRPARTSCRRRSRRATPAPRGPTTPTGCASPRCTRDLVEVTGSPVVELNRAVAVGDGRRPRAPGSPSSTSSSPRTSRPCAATTWCRRPAVTCSPGSAATTRRRAEFERAAGLTGNERERDVLLGRAAACRAAGG